MRATNPIIWTDMPDPDIIRIGNTYYMVSTTMFLIRAVLFSGQKIYAAGKLFHIYLIQLRITIYTT